VPIMDRLEKLECGIYLLARDDPGLAFLLAANRTIHNVVDVLVREQQFSVVAAHLAEMASQLLGPSISSCGEGPVSRGCNSSRPTASPGTARTRQ